MAIFSSTAGKLVNSSLVQPAVISWCTLDGCCYLHSGWLLLFLIGIAKHVDWHALRTIILKKVFHGVGVTSGRAKPMWRLGGCTRERHEQSTPFVSIPCQLAPMFPVSPILPHFPPFSAIFPGELSPVPPTPPPSPSALLPT